MRSDGTAAIGISSPSKLRHLTVRELWIQELVQAQKLVSDQETRNADRDVRTTYIVHMFSLSGVRVKSCLELTASGLATVVLQGCASIVHVEGTATALCLNVEPRRLRLKTHQQF